MSVNVNHDLLLKISAEDNAEYYNSEWLPVWADKDDDATHDDCEAGDDSCEGQMWVSSVEGDVALRFCEKHMRENAVEIDADEYQDLCTTTGLDYS
jgi:hypothetical protein